MHSGVDGWREVSGDTQGVRTVVMLVDDKSLGIRTAVFIVADRSQGIRTVVVLVDDKSQGIRIALLMACEKSPGLCTPVTYSCFLKTYIISTPTQHSTTFHALRTPTKTAALWPSGLTTKQPYYTLEPVRK